MNVGFIGTGNMGGALIKGLLASEKYNVFVYDISFKRADSFTNSGAKACRSIEEISEKSDLLILTIKPNIYPSVLKTLSELSYNKKLISAAPGISIEFLQASLSGAQIVRTMPNTPALYGEGMTLIAEIPDSIFQGEVSDLFKCVGDVSVLPESLIDAGTALSGSSPAMVYRLIDAMANNALSYGINKKEAVRIAAQTVLGSAKTVLESDMHPIELSDAVCSPGGTTIEMVNELERLGFYNAVVSSMDSCVKKCQDMKK